MQGPPLSEQDVPQLLQLLEGCLSQDVTTQKSAEQVLASLKTRQGFCSCLAAVVATPDAGHSARWLASVQLKNCVSKYWRPRLNQGGITPEEKGYLRQRFPELIAQDDSQIAVQVALVVAKAARHDYPREWPSLFSDLLAQAAGGSTLRVRRAYFVLHHVVKELSTKRLAADQKAFAELTRQLFDHVWGHWCGDLQTILAGLPAGLTQPMQAQQVLLLHFERWLILLKIVRRLVLFGFRSDAESLEPVQAVSLVAPALLQAVTSLAAARPARAPPSQLLAMLDRGLLKLVKSLAQIQEAHPWSFHHAGVLLPALEFCYDQVLDGAWGSRASSSGSGSGGGAAAGPAADGAVMSGGGVTSSAGIGSSNASMREGFLVQCLGLLGGVLQCDAYRGRASGILGSSAQDAAQAATIKQMASEVQGALATFWAAPQAPPPGAAPATASAAAAGGGSRLVWLEATLVGGYFPLGIKELEEWEDEPEAFANAAEGGSWQGSARGSAEHLYLVLLKGHRDALALVVVHLLAAASAAAPSATPAEQLPGPRVRGVPAPLLLKEAVYHAVAVGAYELHGAIDYPGWLQGTLLPEAAGGLGAGQPGRLVRRAVAKILGQWVAATPAAALGAVYAALAALLADGGAAVQLAAVGALRALVDDFGFDVPLFTAVVGPVMHALAESVRASSELDTQAQAFGLISLIIERLGPDVRPHVCGMLPLFPQVWAEAEGHSLLRIQVLSALQHLVNVLGADSVGAYPLLLPLLQHALNPGGPEPELVEDGLQLWLVALRNAPSDAAAAAPLLQLFPLLAWQMEASTEHIALGMQVITSLVLLGGPTFLVSYGSLLVQIFASYLGNVRERGMLLLMPPLDLLLLLFPSEAPPALQPALLKLLGLLLGGREGSIVVANALGLYARLLLVNPGAFEQLMLAGEAAGLRAAPPADASSSGSAAAAGAAAAAAAAAGGEGGSPAEQLLAAFISLWTDRFDTIGAPPARKLSALGLAALLGLRSTAPLQQLDLIVSNIAGVWCELEHSGEEAGAGLMFSASQLYSVWRSEADGCFGEGVVASEEAAGEAERQQKVANAEPLRRLRISTFLRERLAAASVLHGPDLQRALAGLDGAIAQQLQAMVGGG